MIKRKILRFLWMLSLTFKIVNFTFGAKCFADELRIVDESGLVRLIASVSAPSDITVVLSKSVASKNDIAIVTLDRLDAVESQIKGLISGRIVKFGNVKAGMWKLVTSERRVVVSVSRDSANNE